MKLVRDEILGIGIQLIEILRIGFQLIEILRIVRQLIVVRVEVEVRIGHQLIVGDRRGRTQLLS